MLPGDVILIIEASAYRILHRSEQSFELHWMGRWWFVQKGHYELRRAHTFVRKESENVGVYRHSIYFYIDHLDGKRFFYDLSLQVLDSINLLSPLLELPLIKNAVKLLQTRGPVLWIQWTRIDFQRKDYFTILPPLRQLLCDTTVLQTIDIFQLTNVVSDNIYQVYIPGIYIHIYSLYITRPLDRGSVIDLLNYGSIKCIVLYLSSMNAPAICASPAVLFKTHTTMVCAARKTTLRTRVKLGRPHISSGWSRSNRRTVRHFDQLVTWWDVVPNGCPLSS